MWSAARACEVESLPRVRHFPAELGRSQVVRHRILIPAFVGSIPTSPASINSRNNKINLSNLILDRRAAHKITMI